MAAKKKAEGQPDHVERLVKSRALGLRDGQIEGMGTAIRLLIGSGHHDAASIVYDELKRRYSFAPPMATDIDQQIITMLARGYG